MRRLRQALGAVFSVLAFVPIYRLMDTSIDAPHREVSVEVAEVTLQLAWWGTLVTVLLAWLFAKVLPGTRRREGRLREEFMSERRIYRVTSIARPVETKYPTNMAILVLMMVAGLLAGLVAFAHGVVFGGSVARALSALMLVFASWALGRELAPDDNSAAFFGTALAVIGWQWLPSPALLPLFTALALSRVVNRSTGLTARSSDSAIVTALVIWTMVDLQNPLLGVSAAVAFVLDARLANPKPGQRLFAVLCLAAVGIQTWVIGTESLAVRFPLTPQYIAAAITLLSFLVVALRLRTVTSLGDIGGEALDPARVRGGMLVVLLLVLASVLVGQGGLEKALPVLAAMAGVVLGAAINTVGSE